MSDVLATSTNAERPISSTELYARALREIPDATVELSQEAWENKGQTVGHVAKTLTVSSAVGTAMGYLLPAKGPAAWAVGAVFTVPMIYSGAKRLWDASDENQKPGADASQIARKLARDTVSSTTELALNLAGGVVGTEAGYALKSAPGKIGEIAQSSQRAILEAENKVLVKFKPSTPVRPAGEAAINPNLPTGTIQTATEKTGALTLGQLDTRTILPEHMPWHKRPLSTLMQRIDQAQARDLPIRRTALPEGDFKLVQATVHVHTKQSDGMGTVTSISEKAKAGGQEVIVFTDHNHLAARDGVKPGDKRIPDQDVPVIAETPKWYSQQFAEAAQQTEPGKFVALIGSEMGTIGKVGSPHQGGKNHFLMLEMPQFFEAVRHKKTVFETLQDPVRKLFGLKPIPETVPPQVVKYNDGDMKGLITHIESNGLKDTAGKDPVFIMAHPRWSQDHAKSLPAGTRGADYGRYSYKTKEEWRASTDKYFRQIEVIKGQALNPNEVVEVGAKDIDFTSFKGYINDGFHVSPTVGRDAHFGNPLGNPAETGILVNRLDKNSVLEGLRERRTIATTNMERLNGTVVANDRFQMGSILDQAVTPDLKLSTRIGGIVDDAAEYTFRLWGDKKTGDRTFAAVMQEEKMTGQQLAGSGNEFSFAKVRHQLGNKGAYFVEVLRKDPGTGHTDHMYAAPFWIEPLSGGGKHSMFMKFMAGTGANTYLPAPVGS